jgi:hypothetical protein
MIPQFPKFKRIGLHDRSAIAKITEKFPPYSDYNFTSLWSWDTQEKIQLSLLHSNLVIKFTDYITGEPFYSFLGTNRPTATAEVLLGLAHREGLTEELRLLPEHSIQGLDTNKFKLQEDSDSFDYILSIPTLMTYKGNKLRAKRNFVNRFKKFYRTSTEVLDLKEKWVQQLIEELFMIWVRQKKLSVQEAENEYKAILRVFDATKVANVVTIGVFSENRLIAFSINEVVGHGYGMLHFEKADAENFVGVYSYTMQVTAELLFKGGCQFLNYEQDLGIPGLKQGKESYDPCHYLKKYIVEPWKT